MKQEKPQQQLKNTDKVPNKKPNDVGSISVEGFVKIFDPKTKEVFVEKRA